jgi:hypothetical protein
MFGRASCCQKAEKKSRVEGFKGMAEWIWFGVEKEENGEGS